MAARNPLCLLGLLGLFSLTTLVTAASTPIATNPILTTITTTSTRFSTRTIGTSTSTTTPILCDDGTCIAISLIDVPILETSMILGVGTVVSTVGFTTIFSDIPDSANTSPPNTPATPTTTPNTPASDTTAPPQAISTSLFTTTQTSGSASGQVSVLTVFQSAAASTDSADASREATSNGSSGGALETKYIAVIAVMAVVIGLAIIGVLVFLFLRRRRAQASKEPLGSVGGDDDATGTALGSGLGGGAGGRHELEHKPVAGVDVAELDGPGVGYRGTAAPAPWTAADGGNRSELPAGNGAGEKWKRGSVHEMEGSVRYELR